jgi:hypothetical protein
MPEEDLAKPPYQEKSENGQRPQGIEESDIPEGLPQGQGKETPQQSQEKSGQEEQEKFEDEKDLQAEG